MRSLTASLVLVLLAPVHVTAAVNWTTSEAVVVAQPSGRLITDDLDRIVRDTPLSAAPIQLNGFRLGLIGQGSPTRNLISAPPHAMALHVEPAFSEGSLVVGFLDSPSPGYAGISHRLLFDQPVASFGFRANLFNSEGERVYAQAYASGQLLAAQGLIELYGGTLYDSFFGFTSDEPVDELRLVASRNGTYIPDLGAAIEIDRFVMIAVPEPAGLIFLCGVGATAASRSRK